VDIRKDAGFCCLVILGGRGCGGNWIDGGCWCGREVGARGCDGGGGVERFGLGRLWVGGFGKDAAGEGTGSVFGLLGRAEFGIDLDFAGLEFAVEVGVDFDDPGVAGSDDFKRFDGVACTDLFEQRLGEAALGAVPFGEALADLQAALSPVGSTLPGFSRPVSGSNSVLNAPM
jgi:hypothetical protein